MLHPFEVFCRIKGFYPYPLRGFPVQ